MKAFDLIPRHRATKAETPRDPPDLGVFVPSCESQVEGEGTLTFWWKVSSESGCDYPSAGSGQALEFYLDGQLQSNPISGEVDWTQKSYTITGASAHTLRWRYVKDGSSSFGDDCGWVDYVQWSGPSPEPAADAWGTLNYLYDAAGRRIEKRMDGRTITKYVYDGDSCLAEYDASGNLRRKYIYGPCIDEPICMIEATQSYAGTYYYHFDALGSVVALTDDDANTVEVYEYDVYGRVGALDASHPNRFMFTGREYDRETGLYYYRARYYNPQIGRFLQSDPAGFCADGMNLYSYCDNSPVLFIDPQGLRRYTNEKTLTYRIAGKPEPLPLVRGISIGSGQPVITVPTVEKPVGNEAWSWENYFWWYRYEVGASVLFYMDDPTALMFRNDGQISEQVAQFEKDIHAEMAKLQGDPNAPPTYSKERRYSYNFATIWRYVTRDPLFIWGHGTLKMQASGRIGPEGYYVYFSYSVDDWFADVLDPFHDRRDDEWEDYDDCTPYAISIWWGHLEIVGNIGYP